MEKGKGKAHLIEMKNCLLIVDVKPSPREEGLMLKLFMSVSRKSGRF